MTDRNIHDARIFETAIECKERHLREITARAIRCARSAIETGNPDQAREALRLRESAEHWKRRIAENREQLARLKNGRSR